MIKKAILFSIFLIIFYYLLEDIELHKLISVLENYSITGLFTTAFLVGFSYFILAYRWYLMTNKRCSIIISFEAAVITGFLNTILPAKAGELSKILYLKKFYKYKINNSLSLLFIERFLDVIILVFFLIIVNIYYVENQQIKFILYIFMIVIVVFFIMLKTNILYKILEVLPFRIINIFGRKIIKNINHQFNSNIFVKTILITIFLWFIYFLTYIVFFGFAVNFAISFYNIFLFFIVSTVVLTIPLTPGGVGTFQASIIFVGNMIDILPEDSLVAGIVLYLIMIFVDFVLFYYVLIKKDISIKDVIKK